MTAVPPVSSSVDAAVLVRALEKVYRGGLRAPSVRALDGVDLCVERGAIFGLLGPNGAGKTTLVKILLGLCRPTGGEAFLLGLRAPDAHARRRTGYLPEGHRFPGHLTGEGALDLMGALSGLSRRERRARGPAILERVGLAEAARRAVRGYSKGMLQRLGLAQALIADPDLLLLDEPTDGVDPVGRREIRDLLVELRKQGKTVVINSHILSEIELVCDRVAVLNGGRLLHEGTVGALTASSGEWEIELAGAAAAGAGAGAGAGAAAGATVAVAQAMAARAKFVVPRPAEDGRVRYLVGVAKEEEIDGVIDAVRAAGGRIRALAPRRSTLEDAVIALLRREAPGGSVPPGNGPPGPGPSRDAAQSAAEAARP